MSPLLLPARRQRPLQLLQHQRLIGRPGEDSLDEVWRQQRAQLAGSGRSSFSRISR
jgi:hypothetical protein